MVITDKFIYIHPPKTGGSFVVSALMETHSAHWTRLQQLKLILLGELTYDGPFGRLILRDKHGTCALIPAAHRHKPILTTVRNPFDYYVSDYEFGWWKRREWLTTYRKIPGFAQNYPAFPEISFPDYLRLMCAAFNPAEEQLFENPEHAGPYTASFVRMFFRAPETALTRFNAGYFKGGAYRADMYPITFITTKGLNQQLYDYLITLGYPPESIRFILEKKKVLPLGKGRSAAQKWEQYYTPELLDLIRQKDRYLFQLFPAFDPAPIK